MKEISTDMKISQSNFELLRIVCIIMIISLHYFNASMGGALDTKNIPDSHFNYYLVRFLESFCIVAVNCFILITGYFMNKSEKIKLKKIIDLIGVMLFYNISLYILAIILKLQNLDKESIDTFIKTFHSKGCWFIIIYILLYILSPFINIVIKNITKKQFEFLILFMLIAFSIYPTFLSSTTVQDNGYGIINFIMLYLIGAYISIYKYNKKNGFIYLSVYIIMQLITYFISLNKMVVIGAFAYNSIFNIIGAVSLFLAFSKIKIQSNIINTVAKHTLGIYIMHVNIFIIPFLWKTCFKTNEFYKSRYLILNYAVSVIAVFIIGLIIDIIREKTANLTFKKLLKNNKTYNTEYKI